MRAVVAWIGVVAACGAATASSAPRRDLTADASLPPSAGLHVERNHLVDHGATVRLLGVNHSGTEYACVKGDGIFEGPRGDALANAIVSWHANAIRLPLNEQCWLDSRDIDPRFSGAAYRTEIARYVGELRAHGLYVIIDLHWSAPADVLAERQQAMADRDFAIDFWRSAAATFARDPGVIFDLFNEPYLDKVTCATDKGESVDAWDCLRDGCVVSDAGFTYRTAGTQEMLDAVRSAGATNVVLVPGLGYSSDLSGWLEHAPHDKLGQIAASLHLYNFSGCSDDHCFSRFDVVATQVPLVAGEIGENDCGHRFVDAAMGWADARGVSYLGWAWNTWDCNRGPALISNYDGTPTPYGEGLRRHLGRR